MDQITPLILLSQLLFVVLLAPLAQGVVRKGKAWCQGRHGASIFLPYVRIATLWKKETLVSKTASFVYHLTPVFVFALTLFLALYVPLFTYSGAEIGMGSFIAFAGVAMLSSVLLVLAGLDTGGVFGGMAASREMTIAALVEPAVLLSFGAIYLHTSQTTDILSPLVIDIFHSPSLLLGLVALVFVALAENARFPVDNPATHLELTMVHEGMILEYSGRQLALLEYASVMKLTIFAVLIGNIVCPWGVLLSPITASTFVLAILLLIAKVVVVMLLLAVLESSIAKMRFYRMQEYLSSAALLGLSAVILTII